MLNIVLYEPEIPPNTGNIIRLCANTGMRLHLIEPISFSLEDKKLKRAGLDYHEFASIKVYRNFNEFITLNQPERFFSCTTKTTNRYSDEKFFADDYLVFGPETRGLPEKIIFEHPLSKPVTIPMKKNSRSLNLSNSVAIIAAEALRQMNFNYGHSD